MRAGAGSARALGETVVGPLLRPDLSPGWRVSARRTSWEQLGFPPPSQPPARSGCQGRSSKQRWEAGQHPSWGQGPGPGPLCPPLRQLVPLAQSGPGGAHQGAPQRGKVPAAPRPGPRQVRVTPAPDPHRGRGIPGLGGGGRVPLHGMTGSPPLPPLQQPPPLS